MRVRTAATAHFEKKLERYRELVSGALLGLIPTEGPRHLYDLVADYPRRHGKGLRASLCMATCGALGGDERQVLNSAVAIELFHNAFLIYDDIQDQSFSRRGAQTLYRQHGTGVAINVGNATNLLALQCVLNNRSTLGASACWLITKETELMMRHSLEGQAMEVGWIRDNACDLRPRDYLAMCLKKTSWYSFIYPLRVGATVARGIQDPDRFCRFGWYLGAAFQLQDDILNLSGDFSRYGKEIGGDLLEGKRTLMLIDLFRKCSHKENCRLQHILSQPREERTNSESEWIYDRMLHYGSIDVARRAARQLAGAALLEALGAFSKAPDSEYKEFILELVLYVVNRDY